MTDLHNGDNMLKIISSTTYSQFRDWLRAGRMKRELTVRQLALLLDESPAVISKIETGQRRMDIYEYTQYCKVLELNPNEGLKILRNG